MLNNYLDESIKKALEQAVSLATRLGINIYLVGGSVRDIYLKRPSQDIDLVLEGNALEFARLLEDYIGGNVKTYNQFLSATIKSANLSIDLITARKESYKSYGSLPLIEPGNIYDDLKRRDFTVNALAINLRTNKLLDPFGGTVDLESKLLRILHKDSLKEDPTRILRGARYNAQLGFHLEKTTKQELILAKDFLKNVSGSRLKSEFRKIINHKQSLEILKKIADWEVMPQFLPGILLRNGEHNYIDLIKASCISRGIPQRTWLVILMALYWRGANSIEDILSVKFDFTKKERYCLEWLVHNYQYLLTIVNDASKISFLNLYYLLNNNPLEIEIFLLWLLGEEDKRFGKEIQKAREGISLPLTGQDLIERGILPGPVMGKILTELKKQVLIGKVNSKIEALNWLEKVWDKFDDKF